MADTRLATRHMVQRGVAMIAVLGGDGTHKAVAAEAGDVPLLTLSTGTNNAFPNFAKPPARAWPVACLPVAGYRPASACAATNAYW